MASRRRKAAAAQHDHARAGTYDCGFTDWVYGPTALTPHEEAPMFTPIPLASAQAEDTAETDAAALAGGRAR
jgi:hypothetical protein